MQTKIGYRNIRMNPSYAKTPCLLDTKLSEQSELLKTLRFEAYTEFTE